MKISLPFRVTLYIEYGFGFMAPFFYEIFGSLSLLSKKMFESLKLVFSDLPSENFISSVIASTPKWAFENPVFLMVLILMLCFNLSASELGVFLNSLKFVNCFWGFIFKLYKNSILTFIFYSAYFCFFYLIISCIWLPIFKILALLLRLRPIGFSVL